MFRKYGGNFREERERQMKWTPKDSYGNVSDVILDPHLRRGIKSPKDCEICKKFQGGVSEAMKDEASGSLVSYTPK